MKHTIVTYYCMDSEFLRLRTENTADYSVSRHNGVNDIRMFIPIPSVLFAGTGRQRHGWCACQLFVKCIWEGQCSLRQTSFRGAINKRQYS